jgi:hypothetical protein
MKDILAEISEDSYYEKKIKIFKNLLFIAAIGGLIAIILLSLYSSREDKINQANTEITHIMLNAMNNPNLKLNEQKLLEKASLQNIPLINFAKLQLVGINLKEQNFSEAAKNLQEIIVAKKSPEVLKQYAKLMLVSLSLDHENIIPKASLVKYIDDLSDEKIQFSYNAKIIKSLYLTKEGKQDEAKTLLQDVLNKNPLPEAIRDQALAILASFEYI